MCMWFGFNPAFNFCNFSTLLTFSFFAGVTSTSPKFDLYLGMGAVSLELRKCVRKVENRGKVEEYEKSNTSLKTFINLVKLLFCLFGKHSTLILGLNTLRKCLFFKTSFKKNSVTIFQNL